VCREVEYLRSLEDIHMVAKSELILFVGTGKGTWQRSTDFRGRTLQRNGKERIPEELGTKKS
jgi:hypothetical protein